MKKILRAALPLGMLALAFSKPARASYQDCLDYCEWQTEQCEAACQTVNCRRGCANFYQQCVITCE
jgi:hypothetical protein